MVPRARAGQQDRDHPHLHLHGWYLLVIQRGNEGRGDEQIKQNRKCLNCQELFWGSRYEVIGFSEEETKGS